MNTRLHRFGVILAWMVVGTSLAAKDPTYQGRTVAGWTQVLERGGEGKSTEYDAILALQEFGPTAESALSVLAKKLIGSNARAVVRTLNEIGPPAVPTLIWALTHPTPVDLRDDILDALADIGPEARTALPVLVEMLMRTESTERFDNRLLAAFMGIGTDSVPYLKTVFKSNDPMVRAIALQVLGSLGNHDAITVVLEGLRDPDLYVYNAALSALGTAASADRLPEERLVPALRDSNPRVRAGAALALSRRVSPSEVGAQKIAGLLSDRDPYVRSQAVLAVLNLPSGSVRNLMTLLERLVRDPDWQVNAQARRGLARLKRGRFVPEAPASDPSRVRAAATN
jgi:HEAT repeat protein